MTATLDDLQSQVAAITAKREIAVLTWQIAGSLVDLYAKQLRDLADQVAALDTGAAIPTTADEVAQLESDLAGLTVKSITDYVVKEPAQPVEPVTP